jgi:hypothetical protein
MWIEECGGFRIEQRLQRRSVHFERGRARQRRDEFERDRDLVRRQMLACKRVPGARVKFAVGLDDGAVRRRLIP